MIRGAMAFSLFAGCVPLQARPETCNHADDDGDGQVDEGFDADGDGRTACDLPAASADCDDRDPEVFPGAPERCNGVDDDCDGVLPPDERDLDMDGLRVCDGDCDDLDAEEHTWDRDDDGWATCESAGTGDCDDRDAAAHPGLFEACDGIDTDCDGVVPPDERDADGDGQRGCEGDCDDAHPAVHGLDDDGDGVTSCDPEPDCDDADPDVRPAAPELCDGVDTDCSGGPGPLELDQDADLQLVCAGDCDDADPARWLGAAEACDGVDGDCDGIVPFTELDGDGDGQSSCAGDCDDGDPAIRGGDLDGDGVDACDAVPDCDDADPATFPGAPEVCDGADNDCDGAVTVDDRDLDGDGVAVCALDCDDADPAVWPGAGEVCDGVDDDCDGILLPEEDPVDADGDGEWACSRASSGLTTADCDDARPEVHTGGVEACGGGGLDEDCDGDPERYTLYLDNDADGHGGVFGATSQPCSTPRIGATYCEVVSGTTVCWTTRPGDCDDFDAARHPVAAEICGDGIDQDCDGASDDGCP